MSSEKGGNPSSGDKSHSWGKRYDEPSVGTDTPWGVNRRDGSAKTKGLETESSSKKQNDSTKYSKMEDKSSRQGPSK